MWLRLPIRQRRTRTSPWGGPSAPEQKLHSDPFLSSVRCLLRPDPTSCFIYKGDELPESQDPQFAGRVQWDKDVLTEGRLTLHVSRLRTNDSGFYPCAILVRPDGSNSRRCWLSVTEHSCSLKSPSVSPPQKHSCSLKSPSVSPPQNIAAFKESLCVSSTEHSCSLKSPSVSPPQKHSCSLKSPSVSPPQKHSCSLKSPSVSPPQKHSCSLKSPSVSPPQKHSCSLKSPSVSPPQNIAAKHSCSLKSPSVSPPRNSCSLKSPSVSPPQDICSECDSDSYQAEENQNITLEWTFSTRRDTSLRSISTICQLFTEGRSYVLFHLLKVLNPRVSGSTVCRTSPVGQRRPHRRTPHTSCLQTQDHDSGFYVCAILVRPDGSNSRRCWLSVTAMFCGGDTEGLFKLQLCSCGGDTEGLFKLQLCSVEETQRDSLNCSYVPVEETQRDSLNCSYVLSDEYVTPIKPRVIGPESGDMKCEASFCEDVFVPLDSSCKLWILRLWGFNTLIEMKQD
ncbi:hypothetical protein F7725_004962 [Dissostichus mawsoni]|uniref:Immunoglobulin V-set domain-containing protein n=1 Tax=Dissostichus mawsoni TaxID=36200 RepID=A0A7J5XMX2_DISMA|nr:hypothetical protein F7725_004962 [Dissostichus mawsoni]